MEILKLKGYILKKIPIKEEDLLIFLYTDLLGKILVKAKSAIKVNNKWARIVETLNLIDTNIYKKREYYYLTESKVLDSFFSIKRDYNKSMFAFQIINLIDKTQIDNNPNIKIFNLITDTLNEMKIKNNIDVIFVSFLLNLLKFEGVLFPLDKCVECGSEINEYSYFDFKSDGLFCEKDKSEKSISIKKDSLLYLENFFENKKLNIFIDKDEMLNIFNILNHILLKNFSFKLSDEILISYMYN